MELFRLMGTIAINNDEATRAINETTGAAETASNGIVSAFKKIGAAVVAAFAVDKIKDFAASAVQAAAEVSAEVSAFDQIMGDYSEQASQKVQKIADATGMVSTRLTPYMTSMTAKFKGLGYDIDDATNLASDGLSLAADAAAFWDKSLDDSMSALNSFINGSYEGGEAIGLFANDTQMASYAVKEGIVSETKEWANLDEAKKQATRLEYAQAMFEASGATGQAAKEAGQYANVQANLTEKWRQFKAQIGEPLLQNIVLPAMEKLSTLVDKASVAMQFLSDHSAAVKAVLIPLGTAIGIVTTALTMQAAVQAVKAAMNAAEVTTLGALIAAKWADAAATMAALAPYLLIAAAIAAVIAVIVLLVKHWDSVKEAAKKAWEAIKAAWESAAEWFSSNVITPIVDFFTGLWNDITAIWDGIKESVSIAWETIKNVVQVGIMFIVELVKAAFQLITLPFKLIWVNCKDTLISIWDAIKSAVKTAINAVATVIKTVLTTIQKIWQTIWNAIKTFLSPILNAIKTAVSTAFEAIKSVVNTVMNAIKSVISTVWNAIKSVFTTALNAIKTLITNALTAWKNLITAQHNAIKKVVSTVWNAIKKVVSTVVNAIKSTVSSVFNALKSAVSTPLNAIKSTVTNIFNGIKTTITNVINSAKNIVSNGLNAIKGFFNNLKLKFPSIKLPHFKITGSFSLSPPSVPKLSIDWYAKGGILQQPTIFGYNPKTGNAMGGGEAGKEAVAPIDTLLGYVRTAVQEENAGMESVAERILLILNKYLPGMANMQLVTDTGALVGALAPQMDSKLGTINRLRERGR